MKSRPNESTNNTQYSTQQRAARASRKEHERERKREKETARESGADFVGTSVEFFCCGEHTSEQKFKSLPKGFKEQSVTQDQLEKQEMLLASVLSFFFREPAAFPLLDPFGWAVPRLAAGGILGLRTRS